MDKQILKRERERERERKRREAAQISQRNQIKNTKHSIQKIVFFYITCNQEIRERERGVILNSRKVLEFSLWLFWINFC